MPELKMALKQAEALLKSSESPRLDAEILMAFLLNKSRSWLYSYSDYKLSDHELDQYQALIRQRAEGKPIAYLTGEKDFWSLTLKINEACLIPRPATETLVEKALELLKNQPKARILDLGTGSGAIALALASERPDWEIIACDRSAEALEVAKANAERLKLANISFYLSDWFSAIPEQDFHAILSNPPYIAEHDPHLQGEIRFEPVGALTSGEDGLEDIRHICNQAYSHLLPAGFLILEHGYQQKIPLQSIMKQNGFKRIQCWQDCEGNDRISCGQR